MGVGDGFAFVLHTNRHASVRALGAQHQAVQHDLPELPLDEHPCAACAVEARRRDIDAVPRILIDGQPNLESSAIDRGFQ